MPGKRLCNYDEVITDAKAGMKYTDIADKYGISANTASRIARQGGIRRQLPAKEDPGVWDDETCERWETMTAFVMRGLKRHGESRKTAAG